MKTHTCTSVFYVNLRSLCPLRWLTNPYPSKIAWCSARSPTPGAVASPTSLGDDKLGEVGRVEVGELRDGRDDAISALPCCDLFTRRDSLQGGETRSKVESQASWTGWSGDSQEAQAKVAEATTAPDGVTSFAPRS